MNDWIDWNGGAMPVPYGTLVDVEYRDGDVFYAQEAGKIGGAFNWGDANGGTIIRYRLHKPEQRSVTLRGQVSGDTMTFTFDGSSPVEARLEAARRELEAAQAAYEAECKEWEPEGGSWFVTTTGEVYELPSDDTGRHFGTERPTRQLAEQARDAMRVHNRALAYVHEHAPEWDGSIPWVVRWHYRKNKYVPAVSDGTVGSVTGPSHVMERLAEDLNSGRVRL